MVGGDCTLLLGAIAGARRHAEEIGMWFVDGHADYLDGASSETGEGADMELAILTGTEPPGLCDLTPPAPMLDPENVVILGHRPPSIGADVAGELERVPAELARLTAAEIARARAPARSPRSGKSGWRRWARCGCTWISTRLTKRRSDP